MNERVDRIPELALTEARVREIVQEEIGTAAFMKTLQLIVNGELDKRLIGKIGQTYWDMNQALDKMVCKTCHVVHVLNKWGAPDCPTEKWRRIAERLADDLRYRSHVGVVNDPYNTRCREALAAYDEAVRKDRP